MQVVRQAIASDRVPCLQLTSVKSHSTSRREKEGKKDRIGRDDFFFRRTSQKSFVLLFQCYNLLFGFLAKDQLPRQSFLSANIKSDNEVKPGLCTDVLVSSLQLRETPENVS